MKIGRRALIAAVAVLSVAGSVPAAAMAQASGSVAGDTWYGAKRNEFRDASGKVVISVYSLRASNAQQVWRDQIIQPEDAGMLAIGGGVIGANTGAGAMVTASYPTTDFSGWKVSTKDHYTASPHYMEAYVIGMRIEGMSTEELRSKLYFDKKTSSWGSHPEASAGLDGRTHALLGGGFNVRYNGAGVLATASFPTGASSWKARAKDHITADWGQIETYAVGIERNLPVGRVEAQLPGIASGTQSQHPAATASVTPGFVLTGGGAEAKYGNGWGSMLWQLQPASGVTQNFTASSKDHLHVSPATIDVYALGIKIV
ncbi:hypothetical protein LWC34_11190 [Kibdelosporangium philippinense]|uniref:Uncharacterized protein n=1 Tax=Kibdelosporangium philippinense TaxID=211113 RepID=A0ABS8Z8P2_9PSEU|nr:hypothetical protein [Kibdelosporangium philippinense]MCE7003388.1 hypothetical protein [Kibdelosporangium philippinense]